MRPMHSIVPSLALTLAAAAAPSALAGGEACRQAALAEESAKQHVVELAICLDTSGSMDGLIDSARARIWDLVSDLATANPKPKLRVAIVQYGNDGLKPENGWTNVETDLTEDLDLVSQKLFALTTNGGTELVGRVVEKASNSLAWTAGDAALRIVIVAGNESADQDQQVRYGDASRHAIAKGILVNSIYCGDAADNIAPGWKEVATLADGHFASIDQSSGQVSVETPFDARLLELNAALNATYLPYGSRGAEGCANQTMQDANASNLSKSTAAQRCVTKGGGLYWNSGWDLVDASKDANFKLEEVKAEDLPEAMRTMSIEAKRACIAEKSAAREKVQAEIAELGTKRQAFIAEETARQVKAGGKAFDRAMRDAIRAQAAAHGFQFPAEAAGATPAAETEAPAKTASAG